MFKESYVALTSICVFLFSMLTSALINRIIIRVQRKKLEGQAISVYLSEEHQKKKLTPTLGGIAIFSGTIASTFLYYRAYLNHGFRVLLLMFSCFFFIGLADDLIKVKKKNYRGLPASIRFLLEVLIALVSYSLLSDHYDFTMLNLFGNVRIDIGWGILIFFPFVLVGSANSVNLTDGLDGLSSSLYLMAIIPFILFSMMGKEYELTYLLIGSFGATLGFVAFNLHPSKIFMGDSGSLSLGALLGIAALLLHREVFLPISGFLFVFETLSVVLQVACFKLTGKRLFLMAPFHHHLEIKGLKEYQIVMYFFIVGLVLSFICVFIGALF